MAMLSHLVICWDYRNTLIFNISLTQMTRVIFRSIFRVEIPIGVWKALKLWKFRFLCLLPPRWQKFFPLRKKFSMQMSSWLLMPKTSAAHNAFSSSRVIILACFTSEPHPLNVGIPAIVSNVVHALPAPRALLYNMWARQHHSVFRNVA